ncbi:MAG: BNR repeat-containing protein [Myxococcota bacterium]|nr:BNR repeat-containing protein [Myxococcota bacterium]
MQQRPNRVGRSSPIVAVLGIACVGLIARCGGGGGGGGSMAGSGSGFTIDSGMPLTLGGDSSAAGNVTGSSGGGLGVNSSAGGDANSGAGVDGARGVSDVGSGGDTGADGAGGGTDATSGPDTGGAGDATVVTGNVTPAVTKNGESLLADAGITIVSFGGYLNGESFQQDGIVSFQGYQYAALWNTSRHVVLGRRALPQGAWATIELTDYTNSANDAHNTISLGICPTDGTLHLSFDHHVSNLHYRRSVSGLLTNPTTASWSPSSFSAVTDNLVGNAAVGRVTYPRFVTEPDGTKMLFEARVGASGSGDEYLWEYDGNTHAWTSMGMYVNGTIDSVNAYPHGLSYTRGGTRLHMSWCWRETPDASTDHDLLYIYSDDNGRTWKNNAGATTATTGSSYVVKNSPGINVWTINQNRGLINNEHMAVDAVGRVHVLMSHMPDSQADDATFDSARSKSEYFYYLRDTTGSWTRTAIGLASIALFRGKLAISSSNDVYAILPDLRIAATSPASHFSNWVLLDSVDSGRFFSDPLIDTARLESEDVLSVFYPQKSSSNIFVLDYRLR